MDNGIACPLYTQSHLAEGVQRVISNKCGLPLKGLTGVDEKLYTIEGKQYFEGVTHYFHDTLFTTLAKKLLPTKLLNLAVKYQLIEQAKVTQFNCTKHHKTKKKIMKVLDEAYMQTCVLFFVTALNNDPDINLPFNIVPYKLKDNVLTQPLVGDNKNQKPEIAVLLRGEGRVSPLYKDGWGSGVETVVRSADGSQYRVGPAKFFHKVIFDMVNSTRLLQLAVELNLLSYKNATKFLSSESAASKRNAVETLSLDSIITLISHLEACSSHHFAVYDLNDNQQPELKYKRAGNQNPDTLILFKQNGMLCQLHVKETADIPGFLKEFVAEQLSTYIDSAFTALLMTEKREYVIRCGDIHPVDYLNSGVIETNKRWGGGLQQMLEMKHQLQISPISVITNFLSHVKFFQRYKALYGLSGTIGLDCELAFLKDTYKLVSCRIPPKSHRKFYEEREEIVHGNEEAWLEKIHEAVTQAIQPKPYAPGRAVLVLCEDIQTTVEIEGFLKEKGHEQLFTLCGLTGKELEVPEAEDHRSPGDIIIATNLAGRGTDIKLKPEVEESGGLLCLLTFLRGGGTCHNLGGPK